MHPDPWPVLGAVVERFRPQIAAHSFRNIVPLAGHQTSYMSSLQTTAAVVRRLAPDARIIAGGPAFSMFARRLMAEIPEIDAGVVGRGRLFSRWPSAVNFHRRPSAGSFTGKIARSGIIHLLCHQQIVFRGTLGFDRYQKEGCILGTDALGFEACIAWRDPHARWVADVMVSVCHDVLRLTGDPQSPLYWKSESQNRRIADRVNHRLVDAFRKTLAQSGQPVTLPSVASSQKTAREFVLSEFSANFSY